MCDDGNCTRYITKWLDAKRETGVKKGQIRKMDTVDNWKIVTDETAEAFYDRVLINLKRK